MGEVPAAEVAAVGEEAGKTMGAGIGGAAAVAVAAASMAMDADVSGAVMVAEAVALVAASSADGQDTRQIDDTGLRCSGQPQPRAHL